MTMGSTPSRARLSRKVWRSTRVYNQKHNEAVMTSLSSRNASFIVADPGDEVTSRREFPVGSLFRNRLPGRGRTVAVRRDNGNTNFREGSAGRMIVDTGKQPKD